VLLDSGLSQGVQAQVEALRLLNTKTVKI